MAETLGDILRDALNEEKPRMALAQQSAQIWALNSVVGERRIGAIRALREVTSIGLKDAKDAIESVDGFMIPPYIGKIIVDKYGEFFTYEDQRRQKYSKIRIFC